LRHVTTIIAGVQTTPKTIHDKGPYLEYTSKAKQKAALIFLNNEIFTTPDWLINKEIYSLTGVGGVYRITNFQKVVIEKILSPSTLGNLLWAYTYQPQTAYSPQEFLKDLQQYILKELNTPGEIDLYRRNLQKVYVDRLIALLSPPKNAGGPNVTAFYNAGLITDISTLVRQNILELSTTLQKKIPLYKNGITKAHLGDLQNRLKEALEPTK
ncbi:MAG TPA: zinc-dependent metalloprotease, partial [Chitinophagaceae bacterium]|nr:zinc-dependent metalloprotease [Chitinophagaceae bacterium]